MLLMRVFVWQLLCNLPSSPDTNTTDDSVECVRFSITHPHLAAVGRLSGLVSIYDTSSQVNMPLTRVNIVIRSYTTYA